MLPPYLELYVALCEQYSDELMIEYRNYDFEGPSGSKGFITIKNRVNFRRSPIYIHAGLLKLN